MFKAFSARAFCLFFLCAPWTDRLLHAQRIPLAPGADVAAAVRSAPPQSHFTFAPGRYFVSEVTPRDGDVFEGQAGTIFDGALPIDFAPGGDKWIATIGNIPQGQGRCDHQHPQCNFLRDLFVDDKRLALVSSPEELTSSTWYFDSGTATAIINFPPSGHHFEISTARWALSGSARNVTLSNLIVEKYAAPPQYGALGGQNSNAINWATGWKVLNSEIRWNHGTGIQLADQTLIQKCYIHDNGQKGLGLRGKDLIVVDNEIAFNNYAGYDDGWEAGGTKFARTTNLSVMRNNVHDNQGPGLWTDIDNINTHYIANTVENNTGAGIQHEISYDAEIRDNIVGRNGRSPRVSLWQAQISIQNSRNVTVTNNKVTVAPGKGNGIVVINQRRDKGAYGDRISVNNNIFGNTIIYEGPRGASGIMDDAGTSGNNLFDHNTYVFAPGGQHFENHGVKTWDQFRTSGHEQHGLIQASPN